MRVYWHRLDSSECSGLGAPECVNAKGQMVLMCPKRGVRRCTRLKSRKDDMWQKSYLGICGPLDEHEKEEK